ncbi:hypothetical protein B0T18DRAFT_193309 [Schizothecium vesticola]|uniref:Uncharacterized protein n=1 Tax=Schizothecium vesticola TaxID=314040 RepID=A0AA40ER22_9PEZI|nr:hypothetical protein B0T18DRAFT_193309 [Schizothecium vesticola]
MRVVSVYSCVSSTPLCAQGVLPMLRGWLISLPLQPASRTDRQHICEMSEMSKHHCRQVFHDIRHMAHLTIEQGEERGGIGDGSCTIQQRYRPTVPRSSPFPSTVPGEQIRGSAAPPRFIQPRVGRSWGVGIFTLGAHPLPPFSWFVESELVRFLMVCVLGGVLLQLECHLMEGTSRRRRRRCRMPNSLLAAGCWRLAAGWRGSLALRCGGVASGQSTSGCSAADVCVGGLVVVVVVVVWWCWFVCRW